MIVNCQHKQHDQTITLTARSVTVIEILQKGYNNNVDNVGEVFRWSFLYLYANLRYFVCSVFPRYRKSTRWVIWDLEWSLNGQLLQKYLHQKLLSFFK